MTVEAFKSELVDQALSRVALIHHQHSIKCCLAIHRLLDRFPHWGLEVGGQLAEIMDEEPRVPALGDLLSYDMDFGGDATAVVEKGLFPAAYVAMRHRVDQSSLDEVLAEYLDIAVNNPEYLGHNVSIMCAFIGMRPLIEGSDERRGLFLDRLAELATAAFHNTQNRIVFEPRPAGLAEELSELEVLRSGFRQPGYFGHQLLTFVWSRRYRDQLGSAGYRGALRSIWETSHWEIPEKNKFSIEPTTRPLDDRAFENAVKGLALTGPRNIHRVTLAEALVDLWDQEQDETIRAQVYAAALRFTKSARPVTASA